MPLSLPHPAPQVITRLLQCGVAPSALGVITPYEGQRAHVTAVMTRAGAARPDAYREVEVSSVDAFQVGFCLLNCFFYRSIALMHFFIR